MLAATLLLAPSFTFGFFGCNRVDSKDLDPIGNPSSANLAQLRQTLGEARLRRLGLLFGGGDLVNNYGDDEGSTLQSQLAAWTNERKRIAPSLPIVPIAGNHELNRKVGGKKMPAFSTYPVWQTWMGGGDYVYGTDGPTPGTDREDALVLDESRMSFTLTRGNVRFIVLSTDTRTSTPDSDAGTALGWIPWSWAARQLDRAEHDRNIKAVFVLGHRNLLDPSKGVGDAPVNPVAARRLLDAMKGKHKLRAFVCAHVHQWDVKPIPGTHALQIIAGDGGSKLEESAKEEFGWVEIRVYPDGRAGYIHHHRPMPKPYNAPAPVLPTVADPEIAID
jgi:hypothetical protein